MSVINSTLQELIIIRTKIMETNESIVEYTVSEFQLWGCFAVSVAVTDSGLGSVVES